MSSNLLRLPSNLNAPHEISWSSRRNHCRDQVARVTPEVRLVMSFLVVFSAALLLVSAWMLWRRSRFIEIESATCQAG
jgi:hypothetical protein